MVGSKLDASQNDCYKSSHLKSREDNPQKPSLAQERELPGTGADPLIVLPRQALLISYSPFLYGDQK